jgi:hypothetical protein
MFLKLDSVITLSVGSLGIGFSVIGSFGVGFSVIIFGRGFAPESPVLVFSGAFFGISTTGGGLGCFFGRRLRLPEYSSSSSESSSDEDEDSDS